MLVQIPIYVIFILHISIVATTNSQCGPENLAAPTALMSPNYPNPHPKIIQCTWILKKEENKVMNILITDLDLEPESCNNSLTISDKKICGQNRPIKPLVITGHETIQISFKSTKNPNANRGFKLLAYESQNCENAYSCIDSKSCYSNNNLCDSSFECADHTDEINCGNCKNGKANCNSNSLHCFDPFNERCDGIKDCPDGEDELDCPKLCENKIACEDKKGCYFQSQICDNKSHCEDNSDEVNCTRRLCGIAPKGQTYFLCKNRKCINAKLIRDGFDNCGDNSDENVDKNKVTITLFAILFLIVVFLGLILHWLFNRRDLVSFINDLPHFPLPPFRGPESTTSQVRYNIEFSESDFRRGGEIYEAFVQTRHRTTRIARSTYITVNPRTGTRPLQTNHNTTCGALALVSLGIKATPGSSTLCEECTTKNDLKIASHCDLGKRNESENVLFN